MEKHSIKIIHVVLNLECGGLEKIVIELCRELNRSGAYRSEICCLEKGGELAGAAKDCNIKIHTLRKRKTNPYLSLLELAYLFKRERPDIVHTHSEPGLVRGIIPARLANVRGVINTKHGSADVGRISKIFWRLNDAIIAVSEDAKKVLLRTKRVDERCINVIHNGIDPRNFRPSRDRSQLRKTFGIDQNSFVIGTAGRLDSLKDYKTLIGAFREIFSKKPGSKLVFIGEGPERCSLEEYAATIGLSKDVLFLGFRKDVPDCVSIFDAFALSSLTEGTSIALLEAMSLGIPAVVTDVGGNPEVVTDGISGFLVPPKNPGKMADAILKISGNPELMSKMGIAAKNRIYEKFNIARMAREYEAIYKKCLNKKRLLSPAE